MLKLRVRSEPGVQVFLLSNDEEQRSHDPEEHPTNIDQNYQSNRRFLEGGND